MLLVNDLRQKVDEVKALLAVKNFKLLDLVDKVVELDDQRKEIQTQRDALLAERNQASKEIGGLYKSGAVDAANTLKEKVLVKIGTGHFILTMMKELCFSVKGF